MLNTISLKVGSGHSWFGDFCPRSAGSVDSRLDEAAHPCRAHDGEKFVYYEAPGKCREKENGRPESPLGVHAQWLFFKLPLRPNSLKFPPPVPSLHSGHLRCSKCNLLIPSQNTDTGLSSKVAWRCNSEPDFLEPAQMTPEPFLVGMTYMNDSPCQICFIYLSSTQNLESYSQRTSSSFEGKI